MYNKDELAALEADIRATFIARKKELNMSDDALGKMAFPYMANPTGKVQALFVGQGAGENRKPQNFRLGEILNLCEALGLGKKWEDVIRHAIAELKKK